MIIHKVSDDTVFNLKSKYGIFPSNEARITKDDSMVTCRRCKRGSVRGPNEWD